MTNTDILQIRGRHMRGREQISRQLWNQLRDSLDIKMLGLFNLRIGNLLYKQFHDKLRYQISDQLQGNIWCQLQDENFLKDIEFEIKEVGS